MLEKNWGRGWEERSPSKSQKQRGKIREAFSNGYTNSTRKPRVEISAGLRVAASWSRRWEAEHTEPLAYHALSPSCLCVCLVFVTPQKDAPEFVDLTAEAFSPNLQLHHFISEYQASLLTLTGMG